MFSFFYFLKFSRQFSLISPFNLFFLFFFLLFHLYDPEFMFPSQVLSRYQSMVHTHNKLDCVEEQLIMLVMGPHTGFVLISSSIFSLLLGFAEFIQKCVAITLIVSQWVLVYLGSRTFFFLFSGFSPRVPPPLIVHINIPPVLLSFFVLVFYLEPSAFGRIGLAISLARGML